jgi:Trp operon repressor
MEQQVQWRRDKVQELCSKEYSQREISQILQVGLATVMVDRCTILDQINILKDFTSFNEKGIYHIYASMSNIASCCYSK